MNKFIKGLFLSRRENAPEFVVGSLSFKTEDLLSDLPNWTNKKGYANVDILKKDDGSIYLKPSTYGLENQDIKVKNDIDQIRIEDVPF